MYRYFYRKNENIFFKDFLILLLSIIVHIFVLGLMYENIKEQKIDFKEVTISEVEFYQIYKKPPILPIQKKNLKKRNVSNRVKKVSYKTKKRNKNEKSSIKTIPKEKIKSENIENINKDKEEKPKKSKIVIKDLDFDKKSIKETKKIIDETVKLKEKEYVLTRDNVIDLMNIEEVGDKKVSKKTLDIVNELENNFNIKHIKKQDFEPRELYKDKKLDKIDRDITNLDIDTDIKLDNKIFYNKEQLELDVGFDVKRTKNNSITTKDIKTIKDKDTKYDKIVNYEPDFTPIKIVDKKEKIKDLNDDNLIEDIKIKSDKPKKNNAEYKDFGLDKKESNMYEITGSLKNRRILYSTIPKYPDWAEEQGIEAVVSIFFTVDMYGDVLEDSIKIDITSGYKKLDDYVISVLKDWKFSKVDDKRNQSGIIKFRFKLS